MAKTLEELIRILRTIEAHRTSGMEKTLRKEYSKALRELQHYVADEYLRYGVDGKLDFGLLSRSGEYARFLDEVLHKANKLTGKNADAVRSLVEEAYTASYEGVVNAVATVSAGAPLARALQPLSRASAQVLRAAVQNPISGLTLNETLEYNRRQIIYDIKRTVTNGIMNGDRYNTMAGRLKDNLNGDYKKAVRIVRTETHRVQEQGRHEGISVTDRKLSEASSDVRMYKIWRSMKDNRVRPQRAALKKPSKKVTFGSKADHVKMEGIEIGVDEYFELGARVKTLMPGSSGNAANDINCRCFLEYVVKKTDGEEVKDLSKNLLEETDENGIIDVEAVRQTLHKVENDIKGLAHEVGAIVGRDGKLLNTTQGDVSRVNPPKELRKGNIFTHNHPSGSTFSPNDVYNFVKDELYEIRAVSAQGTVYRMRWGEGKRNMALADDMRKYPFVEKANARISRATKQGFVKKPKTESEENIYCYKPQMNLLTNG